MSCSLDLELGKVDKDLLQIGPDQREVLNDVPLEERGQLAECIRKQDAICICHVDAVDAVA